VLVVGREVRFVSAVNAVIFSTCARAELRNCFQIDNTHAQFKKLQCTELWEMCEVETFVCDCDLCRSKSGFSILERENPKHTGWCIWENDLDFHFCYFVLISRRVGGRFWRREI